jgi:hypothetical protein
MSMAATARRVEGETCFEEAKKRYLCTYIPTVDGLWTFFSGKQKKSMACLL